MGFNVKIDLASYITDLSDVDKQLFIKEIFDKLRWKDQKDLLEEMVDSLSGKEAAELIENSFDNLNSTEQENVCKYVNDLMGE